MRHSCTRSWWLDRGSVGFPTSSSTSHRPAGRCILARVLRAALQRLVDDSGLRARLAGAAPPVKTIAEDAAESDPVHAAHRRSRPARLDLTGRVCGADRGLGRPPLKPAVSIVIPTWNAGTRLDEVLDALAGSDRDFGCEVIAVNSGSTDGTRQRLRRRGAQGGRNPGGRFQSWRHSQ